jgi:hypothetical protein
MDYLRSLLKNTFDEEVGSLEKNCSKIGVGKTDCHH